MEPSCAREDVNPEIFFSADSFDRPDLTKKQRDVLNTRRLRQARKVCEFCPVKQECLEANLLEPVGTYAGLTPLARAELALASGQKLRQPDTVDHVAVTRRIAGDMSTFLAPQDRREVIRRMAQQGYTQVEIADATRASWQTISSALTAFR